MMFRNLISLLGIYCLLFVGCVNPSELEDIKQQIDDLKSSQIASINSQIAGITLSIGNLQSVDTELRGYIKTLQDQKETLEQANKDLEKSIANLREELSGDITDVESDILNQLETYKQTLLLQLDAIETSITALQDKDKDLQQQITTLQNYIDKDLKDYIGNGDNAVKEWVSATFVTLEKFDATAKTVTSIQGQIELINKQLEQLSGMTAGVSEQELDSAISSLDDSLQKKILKAVSDCDNALSTARTEIATAYNDAISKAISASESSMKAWVNEKLTGYYTLAQTDSKLSTLKSSLESQLSTQKTELKGLLSKLESTLKEKIEGNASDIEDCQELIEECQRLIGVNEKTINDNSAAITQLGKDLEKAKTDITSAYQQAISTAITTLDGKLSSEISEAVESINGRIDTEVAAINESLSSLTKRVSTCETDIKNIKNTIYGIQQDIEDIQDQIAAILARIQSITFVPAYSDGKAVMTYTDNGTLTPGTTVLDFKVQPASLAEEIIKVWHTALKAEAVYTITKAAPETVALAITSASAQDGYLSITISGAGLKEDFFRSRCSANVALVISDGNNECATEYIQIIPWTTDIISFGDPTFKAYCVANFDTDGDGELTEEEAQAATSINASMLNITSLVGIEYFSNLEHLDVSFNKLVSLDLAHSPKLTYVDVSGNKLQTLGIGGLSALVTLEASNNKLASIDISESTLLETLNCNGNQIGALNLLKNKVLKELQCNNNNIQTLDLKNNTKLETLYCRKNSIGVIGLSNLPLLKNLDCSANAIRAINITKNPLLEILYCASNQLSSIGLTESAKLVFLDCRGNSLQAVDISKNTALEELNCSDNMLERLDVSRNTALRSISCTGNSELAKLWVKNASQAANISIDKDSFTAIAYNDGGIYIPDNDLKAYLLALFDDDEDGQISILESENIQNVNCSGRGVSDITGLEVCPNLKYLNISGNNVSRIELPGLKKLETIVAYGNPVSRLNVSDDTALVSLYLQDVSNNAISGEKMTITAYNQATTLYLAFAGTAITSLQLSDCPALSSYDITANDQLTDVVANNNPLISSVNVSTLPALASLDVSNCALTSLNVSDNASLASLNCSSNNLSALNVDNNVDLISLDCSNNQLSTLRVTNNRLLEDINASNNQLLNLNVRQNIALKSLNVANNTGITALALGYNTALETLDASNTGLTDIDLSANPSFTTLNLRGCSSISMLDVSSCTSLTTLDVNSCPIHSLLITGSLDSLIGQYVIASGVEGVIFYANSTVKIVSIDQAYKTWGYYGIATGATSRTDGADNTDKIPDSPAAQWCREKGSNWYLPVIDELIAIYNNMDKLNMTMSYIGGTNLRTSQYWTSVATIINENNNVNSTYYYDFSIPWANAVSYRDNYMYVRAVRAL